MTCFQYVVYFYPNKILQSVNLQPIHLNVNYSLQSLKLSFMTFLFWRALLSCSLFNDDIIKFLKNFQHVIWTLFPGFWGQGVQFFFQKLLGWGFSRETKPYIKTCVPQVKRDDVDLNKNVKNKYYIFNRWLWHEIMLVLRINQSCPITWKKVTEKTKF